MTESLYIPSDGNLLYKTLAYLHRNPELWQAVNTYEASGSGVIVASLLYIGMSPCEIATYLLRSNVLGDTTKELSNEIVKIVGDVILDLYGEEPGMEDLQSLLGDGKTLNIYAYNRTQDRIDVLNHITCPDLRLSAACTMAYNLSTTYYEQVYCGNTYIDVGVRCVGLDSSTKRSCVHARSTYRDTSGPTDLMQYQCLELEETRCMSLEAACRSGGVELKILLSEHPPWDNSKDTRIKMLIE